MWLKPGKKYLFGRVKKDGVRFAIDHKTVSRKHFVITIDSVRDQDVGQVHARTKVTITDENSKAGTNIDGELIRGKSQELKNPVNSIRPGSCPHELLIKWQPCVMTFMLNKKEIKNGDLKTKQDRVKDLDVRAVSDYLSGQTTHLIAQKRNTAKGLQALIEGIPIITEAYIDALIYASTPIDLQEEENLCPLETDFDDAWPDCTLHLPPPGKEPTDKPAEAYRPDPARAKVFDKYLFIFFDSSQYDTLLPPITTGHGKALLFKVDPDTTTVDQGYDFVKKATTNLGRTIFVNVNETTDMRPWMTDYIDRLCSKFGIEPASQSDFLDTVLANNAAQLRKPRPRTATPSANLNNGTATKTNGSGAKMDLLNGNSRVPKTHEISVTEAQSSDRSSRAGSVLSESLPQQSTDDTSQLSRKHDDNPRPAKRARFVPPKKPRAAFDDDFDPDAIAEYDEAPSPPRTQTRNRPSAATQNDSGNSSIKQEPTSTPRNVRNGSVPSSDHSPSEDDEMDDLLPATAAMTRDKARQVAEARAKGIKIASPTSAIAPSRPKKEVKLMDVREVVRAQREAEQDKERKERAELEAMHVEAEEITGPANLVQVTTFDLPIHKRSGNDGTNGYKGDSWKPEWDGRKNFKGFRRARDVAAGTAEAPRRKEKIIIPLEPARRQDYGLGDKYWEKTQEEKDKAARDKEKRRKASQRSQSQAQKEKQVNQSQQSETVHADSASEEDQDEPDSMIDENGAEKDHGNAETSRLQAEAEGVLDHPIDIDAPRQTRGGETQTSTSTRSTTTKSSAKTGKAASKRPASKTPPSSSTRAAPKRQKTLPVIDVHGSDSDDGDDSDDLKFKVGRGRKARAGK